MYQSFKQSEPLTITPMSRLKATNSLMRNALVSLGFSNATLTKCKVKNAYSYVLEWSRGEVVSEFVELFSIIHPKNATEGSSSVKHTMTFGVLYNYPTKTNGILQDSIVVSMYEKEKRTEMFSEAKYIESAGLHSKEMTVLEFRNFQKVLLEKIESMKNISKVVPATELWNWFEKEYNDVSFHTKIQKSGTTRKIYSR